MGIEYLSSPTGYRIQKTIKSPVTFKGIGLHTGQKAKIRLLPAPPCHGIIFEKVDKRTKLRVAAHYDNVISTEMATSLGLPNHPELMVGTVEHLMAGLYAMGITNTLIEMSGPEIPILDGSAAPFVEAFRETGLEAQPYSTPTLKVLKAVRVYRDGTVCELLPRDRLRLTTSVDFPHPSIGLQTFALELTPQSFLEEVCRARTFGFLKDLERLKAANLAQGASLENVLAFSDSGVLNPGGARFGDECVRHKLLDAIGDLALCGSWIEGELVSFRGGHSTHLALLKALPQFRSHWELLPAEPLSTFLPVSPDLALRARPMA